MSQNTLRKFALVLGRRRKTSSSLCSNKRPLRYRSAPAPLLPAAVGRYEGGSRGLTKALGVSSSRSSQLT
jgi:hypothetical protein